ncbi:hypothetical protein BpHYR1_044874 [Brachionus plicatilis]|uniref:Uncharacterized protein n=1 Tax=Brachionus plicatilis TaxID=10195 RepID=A0A3M7R266_BRAPC|nr:hypothetical protein BpHYR1_044874 [Brachionus plicatilis]
MPIFLIDFLNHFFLTKALKKQSFFKGKFQKISFWVTEYNRYNRCVRAEPSPINGTLKGDEGLFNYQLVIFLKILPGNFNTKYELKLGIY